MKRQADRVGIFIVGGLLERKEDLLYDSAILSGPGVLGHYRKTHLWSKEKLLFEKGRELRVFDTPLERVGLPIC